jgi:hypothetical protein
MTKIRIEARLRDDSGRNEIDKPQSKRMLIIRLLITPVVGLEYPRAFLVKILCSANEKALASA